MRWGLWVDVVGFDWGVVTVVIAFLLFLWAMGLYRDNYHWVAFIVSFGFFWWAYVY